MSNRAIPTRRSQRRANLKHYRALAHSDGLLTWLMDINARLDMPLLERTRDWWLDALPATPMRVCLVCKTELWSRDDIGALMFSTPTINADNAGNNPGSASINGVCRLCWGTADAPGVSLDTISDAGAAVLRLVLPHGRFEPLAY